jgi:hypothetical protein
MLVGRDHDLPLYLSALPSKSTAIQKLALVHDTETSPPVESSPLVFALPGSALVGRDHDVPLYLSALPSQSTAIQKLLLTHDTA